MSDLRPDTTRLLELARGAGALTDERRAQIKAGLLSQIAAGGALTAAAAAHVAWGKAAWLSSPFVKGLSALALLSAVGVGVYVDVRAPSAPSHAQAVAGSASQARPKAAPPEQAANGPGEVAAAPLAPAPEPLAPAPGAAEPSAAEPSAAEPPVSALVAPNPISPKGTSSSHTSSINDSANEAPTVSSADTLAGETSLLRDADQALRAGHAARALALLDEHSARYPQGVLAPERNAERVIARCKLGQIDAKSAQSYLASHTNSPFTARIRDACGTTDR